jgi:hypothetical protein
MLPLRSFLSLVLVVCSYFSIRSIRWSMTTLLGEDPNLKDTAMLMSQPMKNHTIDTTRSRVFKQPSVAESSSVHETPSSSSPRDYPLKGAATATATTSLKQQEHQQHRNFTHTFSACLLLKDDNDILNEWIAYHYHVLNLRRIVVAMDPGSETSPSDLFQTWRSEPFGMVIDEWHDPDYMPEYFLQGHYNLVPSFLPTFVQENASASIWHTGTTHGTTTTAPNDKEIAHDLMHINNHRFRQVTFVSHCFETLRAQGHTWVAHIDTDEYLVVNPRLRARPNAVKGVTVPSTPSAGSMIDFVEHLLVDYSKRLSRHCLMMPTLLFGAVEDEDDDVDISNSNSPPKHGSGWVWNATKFETLRWKRHAGWDEIINGMQKAILDVSTLAANHPIFVNHQIKSVHQPLDSSSSSSNSGGSSKQVCRRMSLAPDVDAVRLFPLTINHYVGSRERYLSRKDVRRSVEIYEKKARVNANVDDGWIQGWLASFVEQHGTETTTRVLGDYTDTFSSAMLP